VHSHSGDIDLAMPQSANFALLASTDHGSIENDLGVSFNEHTEGHGSRLEGTSGNGPDLHLNTNRGDITLHKDEGEHPEPPKPPRLPHSPHDAPASES
jgi:Putative adhesin